MRSPTRDKRRAPRASVGGLLPDHMGLSSSNPRYYWQRLGMFAVCVCVCVFFWMQYNVLTAGLLKVPTTGSGREQLTDAPSSEHLAHLRVPKIPSPTVGYQGLEGEGGRPLGQLPPVHYDDVITPGIQEDRRFAVKTAMQFVWRNYEKYAFGADELGPLNGARRENVWGNISCSMVDAIDTLWIMNMKDEFYRARDYIAERLHFDHLGEKNTKISVFETIIREVGGLLSAYSLSKDEVFKVKAKELMDLIVPAFDEKEGVFYTFLNPQTKKKSFAIWAQLRAHIADVGSLQLETRYLSDITGDPKYAAMGEAFYDIVRREGSYKGTGLFPTYFDSTTGEFDTHSGSITIGALADSFYEYLIKVYIYSGKREKDASLRKLYDDAVAGMEKYLLKYSESVDLYYLQELHIPSMAGMQRMDHLLCFVPGMLALGTLHEKEDTEKNTRHLNLAKELMETCYQMYHRQPTGLSPDLVTFPKMRVSDPKYRLRPETVESLFYMYRVTKDEKYRRRGWEIFQSLEKHAKTEYGYGAIVDVTTLPAVVEDKMESFFLAETLKYHYLLQAPEDVIPLDEYVFNTEAHPFRILNKDDVQEADMETA
ncbi:hypothetical protein Poli38472_005845 [Pythium oligandrum]|uniref:alpha-1,2-Mannosidase n=1 Tax=Pythium oligandrum TaxID=41045 RepID=A0A8K1CRB2_PYTOL|nr:hypothetical protein Poli38472_005845 [Pythium oligandrum]|eukprot:TMW68377.1 hypothetical protein Poli38472_005845 [Pythium oligandrum]